MKKFNLNSIHIALTGLWFFWGGVAVDRVIFFENTKFPKEIESLFNTVCGLSSGIAAMVVEMFFRVPNYRTNWGQTIFILMQYIIFLLFAIVFLKDKKLQEGIIKIFTKNKNTEKNTDVDE